MRHNRRRFLIVVAMLFLVAGCGSGKGKAAAPTTTARSFTRTGPPPTPPTTTTTRPVAAAAGAWSLIPDAPKSVGRPVGWTGTEVLVGGFACCGELPSADLAAYNPVSNTWRRLPPAPLTPRSDAAGAWTGTEMVVAGGSASADGDDSHAAPATDGAAWVAATNTWHPIAAMPTTLPGENPTAVWTGREVLVWSPSPASAGGNGPQVVLAYDPSADKWRTLPPSELGPREHSVTVWTGKELVVWGGLTPGVAVNDDGARLDPATGTWRRIESPLSLIGLATAVWSGHEVLVWADDGGAEGEAYDPVTDQWRALPPSPLRAKTGAAGVWTGHSFIVIGGAVSEGPAYDPNPGGLPAPGPGAAAYDPSTNTWTALPAAPRYPAPAGPAFAADQRADAVAVWTGKSVVLVGGNDRSRQANRIDGVKWTPAG